MAGRMRRGNSIIRGSGHSFQNHNRNRDSVLKRKSVVKGSTVEEEAAVFDLVLLTTIDEKHVIQNLSNMYYEDHIYCYIGNVVISVNPFKDLPIYDDKTIQKYRGRSAFDPKLPPHIFALADNVFSDMTFRARDQVVIISGESGAGKTEAAKRVMSYIAAVSKEGPKVNEIKDKLLTTNPLLESFGNAKTTRNDNSSRFGKYMDIQFDFKGNPCGGVITTYLLEKARVTRLGEGERNFHIFYQLLAGGLAAKFGMKAEAKAYALLKKGEVKVRGMNDRAWYDECAHGFDAIGFSKDEVTSLWQSLAAVLLLGNLTFKSDGKAGSKIGDKGPATQCEKLIGTTAAKIEAALTHNTVVAQGELVAADLNPEKAAASRDTLCKAMYQRLFIWMCERINKSIAVDPREIKAVIGVLDIYGFEIFQQNSFEQFCINYCNEKLQQLFIELTLKTEQDEYVAEGIKWEPIVYFNNKVICDLIDAKRKGIAATLDEESIRPGEKSDQKWLENMSRTVGKHDHLVVANGPRDKSVAQNAFMLKHYAGDVTYTVDGFMDKNTDTLFKDLGQLMFESKNPVLKSCFPEGDKKTWKGAAKRPTTAGRRFIDSMDSMIKLLNTKVPSYVRCIKPNHTRSVHKIEDDLFQHQVKYLGLVENVRVRRAGYCFRETYEDFLWRYRILSDKTYPNWKGSAKAGCVEIFKALGIREQKYQLGKTKIFIKHPQIVFRIEEERDDMLDKIATKLQLAWRHHMVAKSIFGWFDGIRKSFKPVLKLDGRNPVYGYAPKKIKWPKHNAQLATSAAFLKKVYGGWWASKMVGPLPENQKKLMRLQFKAHTLFNGKKDGFSIKTSQLKVANHTKSSSVDPDGSLGQFFASQYGKIEFACAAVKISKHKKPAERVVAMTDNALYRMDTKWKVKAGRFGTYDSITRVSVTAEKDGVVVLHGAEEGTDVLLNVASTEVNLVYAFVTHLVQNAKKIGHKLEVTIVKKGESLTYNNTGKPGDKGVKNVVFMRDPAEVPGTRWNPGSKSFVYF